MTETRPESVPMDVRNKYALLAILAIGKGTALSRTQVQKVALILSRMLEIPMDKAAYHFGGYVEDIDEILSGGLMPDIFVKDQREYYRLTEKGAAIYDKLIGEAPPKYREVLESVDALRRLSAKDLEALTYFLMPETASKSLANEEIERIIDEYKKGSQGRVKVLKDKDGVTIGISENG